MRKTADFIEESKSVREPTAEPPKKRKIHPNSLKNLCAPWPKGFAPNPGGKNQFDVSREIAQAVFSQNREEIYKAMTRALLAGNPYAFKELSERAYGKLKEITEITHPFADKSDAELEQEMEKLMQQMGLVRRVDEAGDGAK